MNIFLCYIIVYNKVKQLERIRKGGFRSISLRTSVLTFQYLRVDAPAWSRHHSDALQQYPDIKDGAQVEKFAASCCYLSLH